MAFRFPFSNLHELNLDWILAQVKRFSELIPSMEEAEDNVEEAITTAEQANTTAEQANATAEQANATAEEAKEIAEQATGGAFPSDDPPLMDGTANAGIANNYSRSDHVHPSDSSKADVTALATKADVSALDTKANVSDLATKADVSALNNYVLKAGDTMSGSLLIVKNGQPLIKLQNLVNTATDRASSLFFHDASDNSLAYIEGVEGSGNDRNIYTGVLKGSINNYLQLIIDSSDNCSVIVSHPQAWRYAIGLEDTTTLTDATLVTPETGFTISAVKLAKWGKCVTLYITAVATTAITTESNITFGHLNSTYCPANRCTLMGQSNTLSFGAITEAGSIITHGTWQANATKTFTATYVLP